MKTATKKLVDTAQTQVALLSLVSLEADLRNQGYGLRYNFLDKNSIVKLVGLCVEWLDRQPAVVDNDWIYVTSDSISAIKYDKMAQKLWIKFLNGGRTYSFAGVPESLYNAFISDKSKGSFFHKNIKGRYRDTLV